MSNLKRVVIVSDNDGHDYVLPLGMEEEFYNLLEGEEETEEEFMEKFNGYAIGGSLSLVKLYADFNDLMK